MCGLTEAALAMSAIGAAAGGYSAYQSGQTQKAAANYNATVQRNAALDAQQRGAQAAAEHTEKTRRLIASQTVAGVSNGLVTNSGSLDTIGAQSAALGELDALKLQNNAEREAQGLQAQATIVDYQGQQAATAGGINAFSSLLSGASNTYYGYKKFDSLK